MTLDPNACAVEELIDQACTKQALLQQSRNTAIFHTLLAAEDLLAFAHEKVNRQERAIAIDNIINALKYAMLWITQTTPPVAEEKADASQLVPDAIALLKLANSYTSIFAAYAYAHRDVIHLTLEGTTLRAAGRLLRDTKYEAYNLLLKPTVEQAVAPTHEDDTAVREEVRKAWLRGIKFTSLPTTRAVANAAYRMMQKEARAFYILPPHWAFYSFSLSTFRSVHTAIRAVLYVWKRIASVLEAEVPSGSSIPYIVSKREMFDVIRDVTACPRKEVRAVVNVMEYGAAGVEVPDPALQPLISLVGERYALSAPVILATAAERNMAVLLNMIPAERAAYASLTNEKEAAMRQRMAQRVPPRFVVWSGKLKGRSDLPDVDLALIDEQERILLLVELKWFVDPAEVREVLQRADELAKGVRQCKRLLSACDVAPELLDRLPGAPFKEVMAVVVSANWIGHADVQDEAVPILNEEHFLQKLAASASLGPVLRWLRKRDYLPVANQHFRTTARRLQFVDWALEWYGIDPLIGESFMPL